MSKAAVQYIYDMVFTAKYVLPFGGSTECYFTFYIKHLSGSVIEPRPRFHWICICRRL